MLELHENEVELVNGGAVGVAVALWGLFITGYGSGAFSQIGSELGEGFYDGLN